MPVDDDEAAAMATRIKDLEMQLKAADDKSKEVEKTKGNYTVTSDKKIEKFSSTTDVDEWTQTVDLHVNKKFNNEQEKINFIFDRLHDDVKTEVRLDINLQKSTSTELINLLKSIYGIQKTSFEIEVEFYARNQHEHECLLSYSHELMKILFQLQKISQQKKNTDQMMKQKFADGVRDPVLQQELGRLNREEKQLRFHELRRLAMEFKSNNNAEQDNVNTLMEQLAVQQQQIDVLKEEVKTKHVADVEEQSHFNRGRGYFRSRGGFRGASRGRGGNTNYSGQHDSLPDTSTSDSTVDRPPMKCHYCGELNHIATYCWKRMQDLKSRKQQKPASN